MTEEEIKDKKDDLENIRNLRGRFCIYGGYVGFMECKYVQENIQRLEDSLLGHEVEEATAEQNQYEDIENLLLRFRERVGYIQENFDSLPRNDKVKGKLARIVSGLSVIQEIIRAEKRKK